MNKKTIPILLSLTICFTIIQAQNRIKGSIIDQNGEHLTSATVLLLHPSDSSYVTGAISDETGRFELITPLSGDYLMEVSMLGYRKEWVTLSAEDHKKPLPVIRLTEDTHLLSGVTVTAAKPHIEMESGKITVNLSSSLVTSGGNLVETLRNLPGVMVRDDGTILLNGQTGTTVLIDNKPTYLSGDNLVNYLRSISSTAVETIELISSPSASYDAAGVAGIINIRTKKARVEGVNLPVHGGYNQGKYGRGYGGVNFNLRKNRLSFYSGYSYFKGMFFNDGLTERIAYDPLTETLSDIRLLQDTYQKYYNETHSYRIGIDYDLTSKTVFSLYNRGNFFSSREKEYGEASFYTGSGAADSLTITRNRNKKNQDTYAAGTSITWQPYSGAEWSTSADYQYFRFTEKQNSESTDFNNRDLTTSGFLVGDLEGDINMYSAESSLVLPLSEKTKLNTGAKSTIIFIDNDAFYQRSETGGWKDDNELSNGFAYRENINAGYLQLESGINGKIKVEAGLRMENTSTRSVFINYPDKERSVVKQHYTHLFPTARINYRISDKNGIGLGYGRRIVRPNYRDLNPFIKVRDNYFYEQGNTGLRPELIDNIDFSWMHRNRWAVALLFSYTHNPIAQTIIVQENEVLVITPANLDHSVQTGIRLNGSNLNPARWWSINTSATLLYRSYQWEVIHGIRENSRQFTPLLDLSNQFTISPTWQAGLTGMFYGKMVEGQATTKPMWTVNGAFEKTFSGGKASIRFYVNDIFHSYRYRMGVKFPTLHGTYKERSEYTLGGVTFTYRFSRGKEMKNSTGKSSIDESKRINL